MPAHMRGHVCVCVCVWWVVGQILTYINAVMLRVFILCNYKEAYIQGGPKVGIQYIVNYCIPTFGPPCVCFHHKFLTGQESGSKIFIYFYLFIFFCSFNPVTWGRRPYSI